ncbi:hypothetical protein BN1002_03629 [Bacillus sp. B-jedd]|nr:hypothetical protein BN1002_03629 [Bacillus sp. B-jedd]
MEDFSFLHCVALLFYRDVEAVARLLKLAGVGALRSMGFVLECSKMITGEVVNKEWNA